MNPGPGFIEVLAFYTNLQGHPCQNAVGYEVDPGFDQTTADAISDWLAPSYKDELTALSMWKGVRVIVGSDGAPGEFNSSSSAGVGHVSGDTEQVQVQGLIHKSTAFAGRKFRGRMYIPDLSDAHVSSVGVLDSTQIARLQAIADAWMGMTSADALIGDPQILHSDATAPTPIVAMQVESTVATQRRRFRR